ncbi:hypothetical protein HA402_010894 [Bradysia odoriphaga]|nr:hypothetical protein HA402_010894 [Bradysia odoriphaga]
MRSIGQNYRILVMTTIGCPFTINRQRIYQSAGMGINVLDGIHFILRNSPTPMLQTRAQSPVQEPSVSDSLSTPIRQNSLKSNELEHLDSLVTPIKQLLPGTQPYIRARIIIKSDKHSFTNEKGDGIMSTLDLIDDSGEIRLSAFGTCVHQLYDCVEVDKIYYFSNVRVSCSTCKPEIIQTNQYTLTCTDTTKVLLDSRDDLPHLSFNFEPLSAVDIKEKHDVMDIIGICRSMGPLEDVTLKNLERGKKRELSLIDQSDKEMMVTIWGTNAENFEGIYTPGCVIAFKRARVTPYAGKSLDSSCLSSSTFKVNPNIVEAIELRCWYSSKDEQSEQ